MAQYVYGKNTMIQMLKNHKEFEKIMILKNSANEEICNLAKRNKISLEFVEKNVLNSITKENHQGVIGIINEYKTYSLDEIICAIPKEKTPLLVMLDGLEDPHNFGAILRTCDATGVDGVIIRKNRSVSLTATVAKVSCGAIDTIKVAEVNNLTETLKQLKKQGYWICGADNNEAVDYRSLNYQMPLVLVIGSEGFGISRLVKDNLDFNVVLPMAGEITSLNASVATGVMLYEIYNQRHPLEKVDYGRNKGKGVNQ